MPDDTTALDAKIQKNDYSTSGEEFILKVNKWDRSIGNNVVAKGILSTAGDLAGKDVGIGFENYKLDGKIVDTQAGTYPEGSPYPSVDETKWEKSTEKEMALAHASRAWGPDSSNGFDKLILGPRELGVIISKLATSENRSKTKAEHYTFTLELTHADVYVGDN